MQAQKEQGKEKKEEERRRDMPGASSQAAIARQTREAEKVRQAEGKVTTLRQKQMKRNRLTEGKRTSQKSAKLRLSIEN